MGARIVTGQPREAAPSTALGARPTADLLVQVRELLCRYIVLPADHYFDAAALWTLHAHAVTAADTTPRLIFKSPEKESGKTRALEVLEVLVPVPLAVMNTTTAAIFRLLATEQATVLFDEVDAVFSPKSSNHEDLRAVLNAGYRRGATVARVVGEGKRMRVERFPVFAATALAAIGDLPDTIESRAIIVPMRRRAPRERVEAFRVRVVQSAAGELRAALEAWAAAHHDTLLDAEPAMPDGVTDRAADCWAPLLAIAELAGDEWADRGRQVASAIVDGRVTADLSTGVRLLDDVRTVMETHGRASSVGLCAALNGLEESSWGGWNDGKGIGPRDLARRLKAYGIVSHNVRIGADVAKGYQIEDFEDAWARYLRDDRTLQNPASATKRHTDRVGVADVADVADVGAREKEPELHLGETGPVSATSATPLQRIQKPVADVAETPVCSGSNDLDPLPDEPDDEPVVEPPGPEEEDGFPEEWRRELVAVPEEVAG